MTDHTAQYLSRTGWKTVAWYKGKQVEVGSEVRVYDEDGNLVDGVVLGLRENDPLNVLGCIDVELPSGNRIQVQADSETPAG